MQIFIRGTAKLLAFNAEKQNTIQDVHRFVADESGLESEDILLSLHGALLHDEQMIDEIGLMPGTVLDASARVLGGKTHGRINHAGKVKNSTPKVPPTEKPKKKTGRARRREQYAKRFTNKVASPNGAARGPNSNYRLPAAS